MPLEPNSHTKSSESQAFFEQKAKVSKVKHGVLSRYLEAWLTLLGENAWRTKAPYSAENPQYKRIVYVDGFAGPGKYSDGENGSPMVAYELLLNHSGMESDGPEIVMIFVDKDENYCMKLIENLKNVRNKHEDARNVNLVKYMVISGEFVTAMRWILSAVFEFPSTSEPMERCYHVSSNFEGQTDSSVEWFITNMTPLLVFVDPFGHNGEEMPMTLMREIFDRSEKSEILMNLKTAFIRNCFNLQPGKRPLDLLIGNDEDDSIWKSMILEGDDREEKFDKFLKFYNDKLSEGCSKTRYTCMFEMRDNGNRVLYNLYFATHHKAFQTMKNAIRKESENQELFRFSAFDANKPGFEPKKVNIPDLAKTIVNEFKGKGRVSGSDISRYIESMPTLTQRFRDPLKKALQENCVSSPRKRKRKKFDDMMFEFRDSGPK